MLTLALLVCCLGGLVSSVPRMFYDIEDAATHFEQFIKYFNIKYSSKDEMKMRFEIFKKNLETINERNKIEKEAIHGITKLMDLTPEEFESRYLGLRMTEESPCEVEVLKYSTYSAPEEFDWRSKNVVTRVKDQGKCGSCWAFGATGNLESQYAMLKGELLEFSESQLLDCDENELGCLGGLPALTMKYLQEAGGIMSEKDYPYEAVENGCKFDQSKVVAKVKSCTNYAFETEEDLKEALVKIGPISIGVNANTWLGYTNGVMKSCPIEGCNHAVLLVGYGTDNGTPYWTIKNSWSAGWGESGYIRIKRNENSCNFFKSGQTISATIE